MLAIGNHNELADRLATGLTVRHPSPPAWATAGAGHGPFNYLGGSQGGSMQNYSANSGRSQYSHFNHPVPMSPSPYSRGMENGLYNSYSSLNGGSAVPQTIAASPKPQSMHSELYSSSSSLRNGIPSTPQNVVRASSTQLSTPQHEVRRKTSDASHNRPASRQSFGGGLPPTHQAPPLVKPVASKATTIVSAPRVMQARKDSYSGPSSASYPRPSTIGPSAPSGVPVARSYGDRSNSLTQSRSVTPPNALFQHDLALPAPRRSNSPPVRAASPPGRSSPPARPAMPAPRRSPPTQASAVSAFGVQRKAEDAPLPQRLSQHELVQEVGYLC